MEVPSGLKGGILLASAVFSEGVREGRSQVGNPSPGRAEQRVEA